ncbi:MAG: magnesium chelatase domain-containing protein, partial [Candidatus Aminicenantales bacterium]
MLLAIVERKLGFSFAGQDIYLNVAGGLTIDEPAADLGVAMAVVSCLKNKAVAADVALFGEVGLSGEIRSVSQPLARIKEADSLGFRRVILPEGNKAGLKDSRIPGLQLLPVKNLRQAVNIIF